MKILMTADTVGGVWTYAMELCSALAKGGVEIALCTMGPKPNSDQRQQFCRIPQALLFESEYKLEWMQDPWQDVQRAGEWLLDVERQFRPDIVHLNGYVHAHLPWRVPRIVVAHSCVYSWWLAVWGTLPPEGVYGRYRNNVREGLASADGVVAPTDAMLSSLRQLYGRQKNSFVVPNGRSASIFHPAPMKEPFIFSAGRLWDSAKNVAGLDRIGDRASWPICLAGEEAHPQGSSQFRRSNACIALGFLNQQTFANLLGRAGIFCLPAKYEPFGLAILEAALSGCALVLGDIPSLRELWSDAAVFVPPADDQALVTALCELIASPSRRRELSDRAQRRASIFTVERMTGRYLAIYSAILNGLPISREREVISCES